MKRIVLSALLSGAMICSAQAQRLVPQAEIPNLVQNVQSDDSYRVIELEETIRKLNGKVEELNFLLLQLQEKLRNMEEENEGRFQELEEHHSKASDKSQEVASVAPPKSSVGEPSLGKPEASAESTADAKLPKKDTNMIGPMPRRLGTLTFDKNGNVVDSVGDSAVVTLNPFKNATEGALEASEFGATPAEVYKEGKAAFDARKYPRAQRAFSAYLAAWPKDPQRGEARYYLGESLFWQKAYYQSAEIHLQTHNEFPEAETAPDNLLGLGLSLAGLNQREVACATYAEVLKQYPDSAARLTERIKDEQAAARC